MYQKGDFVNYSAYGICEIADIRVMDFQTKTGAQKYYVLRSISQESAVVYLPVDNPKTKERIRPVLSPQEIDGILRSVKDQRMLWVSDRKQRLAQFQEILSRRDARELLLLASCLYLQSKESEKGLSSGEQDILRRAESLIEQEFAFSLKINPSNIGEYIQEKLQ